MPKLSFFDLVNVREGATPGQAEYLQCLWRSNEDDASRIFVGMPNRSIKDPFVIDKILSHLKGRGSLRVSDSSPKEHARRP